MLILSWDNEEKDLGDLCIVTLNCVTVMQFLWIVFFKVCVISWIEVCISINYVLNGYVVGFVAEAPVYYPNTHILLIKVHINNTSTFIQEMIN